MLCLAQTLLPPSVHGGSTRRWAASSVSVLLAHGQDSVKNTHYWMSTTSFRGRSHLYHSSSKPASTTSTRTRNKPNIAAQALLCSMSTLAHRGRTADPYTSRHLLFSCVRQPCKRHISSLGGADRRTEGAGELTAAATATTTAAAGAAGAGGVDTEELARCEEEVLEALLGVCESCSGKQVVQLGLVQELLVKGGTVTFTLRIPTMALPGRRELVAACEEVVRRLSWVEAVTVSTKARRPRRNQKQQSRRSSTPGIVGGVGATGSRTGVAAGAAGGAAAGTGAAPGLESVRDVVCVSSCKGGVGKSTVAVNLAYALAARGATVGLLDADIYGPSLPTLVNPDDVALRVSPAYPDLKLLSPVRHRGVACMSFGWVNAKAGVPGAGGRGAAVMRGPMVAKVINQLLLGTDWGELEYLIIDMPPGTGDIQITLCQALQMSGAVVVSTPQKLSYVDVVKGVDMFGDLKVPVLSVVENMAYFDCNHGERHRPFGPGHVKQLVQECGVAEDSVFSLPLSPAVAAGSDCGDPVTLSDPEGHEAKVYLSLADAVVREAYRAGEKTANIPQVYFKPGRGIVLRYMSEIEATEFVIPPFQLRIRDPATGEELSGEQAAAVREDVEPVSVSVRGNYAVSISWSDGHRGAIYSYGVLRKVAETLALV